MTDTSIPRGLATLLAASEAVSCPGASDPAVSGTSNDNISAAVGHCPNSLLALLNPIQQSPLQTTKMSLDLVKPNAKSPQIPGPGFVIGKDGKNKKKRGRKPKPGLTDEDRRQARLLKNRRTAESSRRRKAEQLQQIRTERDEARAVCARLQIENDRLRSHIQAALARGRADTQNRVPGMRTSLSSLSGATGGENSSLKWSRASTTGSEVSKTQSNSLSGGLRYSPPSPGAVRNADRGECME